jgi:hypothetical protein
MSYVLNTSFVSEDQLLTIEKKATTALFRKCGCNRNTATFVKFRPPRLCGIGFRHLYTEQSLLLTCMVIKHLRIEGQAQHLFHISLSWAQLSSGVGVPILEFPDHAIPTLEDPFLQGIRAGMTRLSASIRLLDNFVRPLSRTGDFYLIDGLQSCGIFSASESLRVNYCRLYLVVYLASDVASPDGKTILPGMFRGSTAQRLNQPSVMFLHQARPDAASWTQWRRALRALFTAPPLHPVGPS